MLVVSLQLSTTSPEENFNCRIGKDLDVWHGGCLPWRGSVLKHQSLSATHLWNPTFCIRLLASRFCHRDIKQPKPPHCTPEASKCVQVEGLGNPKKVEFHAGERIFADQCLYWKYIPIFAGQLYSLTCEENQMLEMVECFVNVFSYSWWLFSEPTNICAW